MGHFYDREGKDVYTVPKADGKGTRDTNIRDARKLTLVPSYSTVVSVLAKGSLDRWKQLQLLNTVEKYPHLIGNHPEWKEQLIGMSDEENSKYAKRGTEIHDALEQYYKTDILDEAEYIAPVIQFIEDTFKPITVMPELSFAHNSGYGGKIDLVVVNADGKHIVDFKTKSKDLPDKSLVYDDYAMQLAAYGNSLTDVISHVNILISVTNPGKFYTHVWSEEEISKGFKSFSHLLEYWKIKNNYDSSFTIPVSINENEIQE